MTPYRIVYKFEEFQIWIAAASSASRHTAVLFSVHYWPSQIHYSLNTVFPINRTSSRKNVRSYDFRTIINEHSLYIYDITMTFSYLVDVNCWIYKKTRTL